MCTRMLFITPRRPVPHPLSSPCVALWYVTYSQNFCAYHMYQRYPTINIFVHVLFLLLYRTALFFIIIHGIRAGAQVSGPIAVLVLGRPRSLGASRAADEGREQARRWRQLRRGRGSVHAGAQMSILLVLLLCVSVSISLSLPLSLCLCFPLCVYLSVLHLSADAALTGSPLNRHRCGVCCMLLAF